MIHNYYLPLWLHRICNGLFGAALLVGFGSIWLGMPTDSWQNIVTACLIWLSIPVGIILALASHRFSIVEGVAGEEGYDELRESRDEPPKA